MTEAIVKCQEEKGMLLPSTPLSITFENIRYSVDMPKETNVKGIQGDRLEILKGVSRAFRSGVLTTLMGVSGAGKTMLLDILARRNNTGYVKGIIKISSYPKKQKSFARVFGYYEQNDIHLPLITVYESLLFSAWLRLPSKIFFKEVMELIALTPMRNALVGFPNANGLSIEQRKRLTITVELVANPSIIFMDEPTIGLDSRATTIVMRTLFLLSQGGEEIYVGPLGNKSLYMINYFEQINNVCKIEDVYNPATWVMEVTTRVEEELLGVKFADYLTNLTTHMNYCRRNKALIEELSTLSPNSKDLEFPKYSTISHSMQSMPMETTQVLLKKHII
ncbi:hypothetical protein ACSBR2_038649 [Camellia fascicularis]